ncbi:unnamed protein product [Cuscuta epithymum]|uniref:Uncharacterized protein n=1 Tax=Cuscuta epithymum TaxID=186058 RepID=A0AAV0E269_9ASTE|nr:unnamed protein product [Cuscuta epithymum]
MCSPSTPMVGFYRYIRGCLDLILKTNSAPSGSRSRSWSVWVKFQKHFWSSNLLSESVFLEAGGYQLLKTDSDSASTFKKEAVAESVPNTPLVSLHEGCKL